MKISSRVAFTIAVGIALPALHAADVSGDSLILNNGSNAFFKIWRSDDDTDTSDVGTEFLEMRNGAKFFWSQNGATSAFTKMVLDENNKLIINQSGTVTAGITLDPAAGTINLHGLASGISFDGTPLITAPTSGPLTFSSVAAFSSTATNALTVGGGIGTGLDSYFNGVRVGKGNGSIVTNVAVGSQALNQNFTGTDNTALGYKALYTNIEGLANTAIGSAALMSNSGGMQNTGVGMNALKANTTGGGNSAFGLAALANNTTGAYNTAMGTASMQLNTTGYWNVAIGVNSMQGNATGAYNVAVGYAALGNGGGGTGNTAVGYNAMINNVGATNRGALNSSFGYLSMTAISTGASNTALGASALSTNSTGGNNVAVGTSAGKLSSGSFNPSGSIFIGANSKGYGASDTNSIVIGNSALGEGDNTTVIGNSSTTNTHLYGTLNGQVSLEAPSASNTTKALRVTADGAVLVRPQGDVSMGIFTSGSTP